MKFRKTCDGLFASMEHGKREKILVIGAVPPPFIGPTVAVERLVHSSGIRTAFDVVFLDISDRRGAGNIGKFDFGNACQAAIHAAKFLTVLILAQPRIVYLNISQGRWGYIRDLCFILPSIISRRGIVLHLRGSEFRDFFSKMSAPLKWITRAAFRHVTRAIVLGNNIRHEFRGLIEDYRVEVIPNGIDCREFGTGGVPEKEAGTFHILFLSSLRRRKGIFELLEAIPLVLKECGNIHVTIAGEWREESEERAGKEIIRRNKLNDVVDFVGHVSGRGKVDLYRKQDLFVFTPVEPEGLPWVLLEAMSASLPVISSRQGAIPEVVEDGRTGFLVEASPKQIAEKILFFVKSPALAAEFGRNGRMKVEREYSEEKYIREIVRVLRDAAEEVRCGG